MPPQWPRTPPQNGGPEGPQERRHLRVCHAGGRNAQPHWHGRCIARAASARECGWAGAGASGEGQGGKRGGGDWGGGDGIGGLIVDSTRWPPRRPKGRPRWPKRPPRRPQRPPGRPKGLPRWPKRPPGRPKRPQNPAVWATRTQKKLPRGRPRWPKRPPRGAQEANGDVTNAYYQWYSYAPKVEKIKDVLERRQE